MIHFNEIANPPTPVYIPMCVACDGRGVVPSLKATQKCDKCNGTGKQMMTPLQAIEQEIKRLNAQSYEPSSASVLALIQMLVDVLKEGNTPTPADPIPAPTYQELRRADHPQTSDYLDGIFKGSAAQVQAYVDACLAVKAKYPKP